MKYILVLKSDNSYIDKGIEILSGHFPENEPETEMWKLIDEDDRITYAVKDEFNSYKVDFIPDIVLENPELFKYTPERFFYKD